MVVVVLRDGGAALQGWRMVTLTLWRSCCCCGNGPFSSSLLTMWFQGEDKAKWALERGVRSKIILRQEKGGFPWG